MATSNIVHRSLWGAGIMAAAPVALAILAVGVNQALAPLTTRRVKARFEYHETRGGDPHKVFVVFHGLWSADWAHGEGDYRLNYFLRRGNVLVVLNGSDVYDVAQATYNELDRLDLLDERLYVDGFSMGTGPAVLFLRLYRQLRGKAIRYILPQCGPPTPAHVIWPSPWLHRVVRWFAGGPLMQLAWYYVLAPRLAQNVTAARQVHASAVISGGRLLWRGIGLLPGEFPDTEALIIFQEDDHRVRPGAEVFQAAFPNSRAVVLPGPGHGDFHLCQEEYFEALDTWLNGHQQ
jgi:pimeloyl-ACP methyl ester carboxylesterase